MAYCITLLPPSYQEAEKEMDEAFFLGGQIKECEWDGKKKKGIRLKR